MDKAAGALVMIIITIAVCFFIFNTGVGDGLNDSATRINTKMSTFDYSGNIAPGNAGHTLP